MTASQREFLIGLSRKVHEDRSPAFLTQLRAYASEPTTRQASHWIESLKMQRDSPKPRALILDVDGTACDVRGIRHYLFDPKDRDFDRFHRASSFCPPNEQVIDLVRSSQERGLKTVVVTARQHKYRDLTEGWFAKHEIDYDAIYLRADNDFRPDYEVKQGILADVRESYNPIHAIDDNPNVLRLWCDEGVAMTRVPGYDGNVQGVIEIHNPFATTPQDSQPKQGSGAVRLPEVEAGRYAVPTEEGKLAFYEVSKPTRGKWAGRTFVSVLASDTEYPVRGKAAQTVLNKIAANPKEALARYGQEIGVCGACNRTLTDEESRRRGVGPVCAAKMGF